jgi:aminoglycoside 6'-N-acetyltransferase I
LRETAREFENPLHPAPLPVEILQISPSRVIYGTPTMLIRPLQPDDRPAWLRMRCNLWPDFAPGDLEREQADMLADPARNAVFVAQAADAGLAGFVEVSLHDWAEGCTTHPVGYIEAWYVEPRHRRTGVGRRLIEAAEQWARSLRCTEMASDAELANTLSHTAHAALGYSEVIRVVLFSKKLELEGEK